MSIKFLVLGGVFWVFFWGGGGGSADFIFMGARIFLTDVCSMELPQTLVFFFSGVQGPFHTFGVVGKRRDRALWERKIGPEPLCTD